MTRRMMMGAVLATICAGAAALPARALAHEGHGLTIGVVQSVAADSFELKTAKATVTVKFAAATKFEQNKKIVDKSLLRQGDRVGVAGTKAKDGTLNATRIVLGLPVPAPKAKPTS